LYFTPQVGTLVLKLWWAIALGIIWALALGWGFGLWLQRRHQADLGHLGSRRLRATSYFASAIGGASEMTLLAERTGARTDLVAAAHSLRLVMVVISVPFAMQWAQSHWGLQVDPSLRSASRAAQWPGLLWLAFICLAGVGIMVRLRRTNPWFMGSLVAAMLISLAGISWSAIPTALSNAAQLFIGVSLGVRFQREFLHTAPRWLASVAMGTAGMLLISALFGWAMAELVGQHPATLILGTSPGGIAEMAITAKVLQLGVPVVTAFQVCRLVAVLVLAYALGMAGFTMIMGNAFAAFPVMTAGIGLPLLVQVHGADAAPLAAIGMLTGYCGTLMTPMAANFNIVPVALLELRDQNAVIRMQVMTALPLIACNLLLIYWLALP